NGALFFSDYGRNCIWAMMPAPDGLPDPNDVRVFDSPASAPVNLTLGPDGYLYYVSFAGSIRRIVSLTGNSPPIAAASATPASGPSPLSVQLDATGSTDPDGDTPLTYAWDLNGDGVYDDATGATPTHVFSSPGVYDPAVEVMDPDGASSTAFAEVRVSNPP